MRLANLNALPVLIPPCSTLNIKAEGKPEAHRSPGSESEPSSGSRHVSCCELSLLLAAGAGEIFHAGSHAAFHQAGMPGAGGAIGGDAGWNVHGHSAVQAALLGIIDEIPHIRFNALLCVASAMLKCALRRPCLNS